MAKLPKECQPEINVEDLLRLKRSERPSEPFWNDFDRELHQRMLQTLVKKDPWYLQVMRAFSGRILQSTAVAAAAVVIAMVVVRPAFQPVVAPVSVASAPAPIVEMITVPVEASVEVAVLDVVDVVAAVAAVDVSLAEIATPDYHIDVISVEAGASDVNFVRDFGMESLQVASYDTSAYRTDSPHARASFASAGVASIVY